jgi:hypothetical protein
MVDEAPEEMPPVIDEVEIEAFHLDELPSDSVEEDLVNGVSS